MKHRTGKTCSAVLIILACFFCLFVAGCEGSDMKKAITDTVDKAVGGDVVRKGEDIKRQADQAMKKEAARLLKMDKGNKGEEAQDKEAGKESEN